MRVMIDKIRLIDPDTISAAIDVEHFLVDELATSKGNLELVIKYFDYITKVALDDGSWSPYFRAIKYEVIESNILSYDGDIKTILRCLMKRTDHDTSHILLDKSSNSGDYMVLGELMPDPDISLVDMGLSLEDGELLHIHW